MSTSEQQKITVVEGDQCKACLCYFYGWVAHIEDRSYYRFYRSDCDKCGDSILSGEMEISYGFISHGDYKSLSEMDTSKMNYLTFRSHLIDMFKIESKTLYRAGCLGNIAKSARESAKEATRAAFEATQAALECQDAYDYADYEENYPYSDEDGDEDGDDIFIDYTSNDIHDMYQESLCKR